MADCVTLPSGLRVVVEPMPYLHSLSVGLWVQAGSAFESEALAGASHFLEHLLFKGTERRSALEISAAMDNVGGVLNAFTAKEHTCFYTRALSEYLELSIDLLSDMYCHALLEPAEVERERSVIIEEINMYEDSPDEVALDLFCSALWPQHSYGRSVAGSIASVGALSRSALYDYWRQAYVPANTVLAVAGNVVMEQVTELAARYFQPACGAAPPQLPPPQAVPAVVAREKEIEQGHVVMGFPAFAVTDPDYDAAAIVANALGGGASSRLFQEVREKRGLSYSAFSLLDAQAAGGYLLSYAATQPERSRELIEVMAAEYAKLAAHGLSDAEIAASKAQLKGSLLLSMENSSSVMSRLGRTLLEEERVYAVLERVERLMRVSREQIDAVIRRLIRPEALVLAQVSPAPCPVGGKELFA